MCKMEQRGDEICCFNIKKKKKSSQDKHVGICCQITRRFTRLSFSLGFDSTGREAGGVGMLARRPSSFRSYFAVTISSAALGEGRSHPEPEPRTLPSFSVVEKKG